MEDEQFIGEIMLCGFNFEPYGWAFCEGRLLAINECTALFSIIGVTFGGDARTTFALPDLRDRIPVGVDEREGGLQLGETGGSNELPVQTVPAAEGAGAEAWSAIQPVDNRPAHVRHRFIIALEGIFPSRH